jgi:hypothetical protein
MGNIAIRPLFILFACTVQSPYGIKVSGSHFHPTFGVSDGCYFPAHGEMTTVSCIGDRMVTG